MNNFWEERQDLIDRYIRGEMSSQECSDFESSLPHDKELQEQLEFSKIVKQSISSRSAKLEKMSQWEKSDVPFNGTSISDSSWKDKFRPYRWAASVVVMLSVGIFAINMLVNHLFEDNNSTIPTIEEVGRDSYKQVQSDSVCSDSINTVNDSIIYLK